MTDLTKLPKTKDGVAVVPNVDSVWWLDLNSKQVRELRNWVEGDAAWLVFRNDPWHVQLLRVKDCFSTREAAEAARDA